MNTIAITVPFAKKHLITEIKNNGGKFNSETKIWNLEDNPDNRTLKEIVERRIAGPSQKERVNNIANLAVDLLNSLKYRQFTITEAGDRIVLESMPLFAASTPPVVEIKPLVAAATPVAIDSTLFIS